MGEYERFVEMHDKCVKTSELYKADDPMYRFWINAAIGFIKKAELETIKCAVAQGENNVS